MADDDILQFSDELSALMISFRGCWIVPVIDARMPHLTLPRGKGETPGFFQRRAAFGRKWRIYEEVRLVRVEGD